MAFFAQNCAISRKKNVFANFCASFAHEAEQLLRHIPHCSASHAKSLQNYLRNFRKSQICAICSQIEIAQNAKFCEICNILRKK